MKMRARIAAGVLALALPACASLPSRPLAGPTPVVAPPGVVDVDALLAQMSVERKVAQIVMPDISAITPEDMRTYRFGTILNGGNRGPGGNDKAAAPQWLALADAYWAASTAPLPSGESAIPALWATDAVHGHSNLGGATLFPHNIGLGATRDADLVRRIGAATAAEIAVTGIDWTFAPTLAVATDDRWGRTYESYSENPELVSALGEAMILGLQGEPGTRAFLDQRHVIATAKHFFADGGTGGKDRGDTRGDLAALERVHAAPYRPAIAARVQTAMASFSSINGSKMHGNRPLLTGYLRGELGFDGVVVGDWNGHGELPGCSNADCPQALLAGLDIYMVPEDWKALHTRLVEQVRNGTIPQARLDEAVRRVLRLKQEYGLFAKPRPALRALAGQWDLLGSPGHRALAREAVRKSLVLLKNDGVLPLKASARILVAGAAADSVARQSGGWSVTWQGGGGLTNSDFPGATSIFAGIAEAMAAGGGSATLSPDGSYQARPDVAVLVFGEAPYAEFVGDREDLALRDEEGLALLSKFESQGIPTVAVFLSGRPMWTGREIARSDAFVAAWLPGSEGQGVADVLVGDGAGRPHHDFTGKLGFGWPAGCAPGGAVLAPFGFGASYARPSVLPVPETRCALLDPDMSRGLVVFNKGLSPSVSAFAGKVPLANFVGVTPSGSLKIAAFDVAAQEDARRIAWAAPDSVTLRWKAGAWPKGAAFALRYKVDQAPERPVTLIPLPGGNPIELASSLTLAAGKGWRSLQVPLSCFGSSGLSGIELRSAGNLAVELQWLAIVPQATDTQCAGPF